MTLAHSPVSAHQGAMVGGAVKPWFSLVCRPGTPDLREDWGSSQVLLRGRPSALGTSHGSAVPAWGRGGGLATMFSHLTNEETGPRDHDTGFELGWLSSEVHDLNLRCLRVCQELNGTLHVGCLHGAQAFSMSALWQPEVFKEKFKKQTCISP